jgi:hypothetical protein
MKYDFKAIREEIRSHTGNKESAMYFLRHHAGIDVTRDGKFKVRYEERTPSCVVNDNGSFHDYGTGEHYSDVVSLLFDGYSAFDTLLETITYLCQEYNIDMEKYHA